MGCALWWPHLGNGLAGAVAGQPIAFLLHLSGAGVFAAGAARGASWSIALFYFVLGAVLPLLGMLTSLGVRSLLSGGRELEPNEDDLVVGNPITATRESRPEEASLRPIVRMMRELDSRSIGRMILGLSKAGEAERGYQVLRRFQQDDDVELQFYAQNAQRGVTDGLERRLRRLRMRLDQSPGDPLVSGALAEVLIGFAGLRTTSSSDANSFVRRALEHLKQLPEGAKRAALEVRGYLLVKEPAAARAALERLPEGDLRKSRLSMEVFFAERDWARLSDCARGLEATDIPVRTARAFWGTGV
ncbi:MAG: hypothetical protein ACR2RV_07610 [Verrucomicrobiales bacterium]